MSNYHFEVWIGCLACYNDGRLMGNWVPASEADEWTTQRLHASQGIAVTEAGDLIGGDGWDSPHEELWVMDLDNAPEGFHREMSPHEAQMLSDAMYEIERQLSEAEIEPYFMWVSDHYSAATVDTLADYVDEFQDAYCGEWESFIAYAMDLADEIGAIPAEHSWPQSYIDWDAAARDLAMDYSTYYAKDHSGVYVFRNN